MTQKLMLFSVLTVTAILGNLPAQGRADRFSAERQQTASQIRHKGPETGPAGHWEGVFKVNDRETGLTLDLARDVKTGWIASMGIPAENLTGLLVMEVVVKGNSVKFVAVELTMTRFDLTLEPDGTMGGTISNPQRSWPIEFKRTGEAKVQPIPASPAVSDDLQGDWEGLLQVPGREFPVLFHFKNQAEGTVAATAELPKGNMGVPLNDVKQTGRKVEIGIRVAHATFQRELNSDGTELVGQFAHGQNSVPLTLRKK